ncbi:MAG: hypothetical protein HGA96_14740 [Desulfobulbaceae bacterium]|nr:hypothetical protein [Desulfobulbaceae bacterium]
MKYYGTWELDSQTIPDRFFSFSTAYLDSAERLCKTLIELPLEANYERGAVVLYLTFHATELFLKGAIISQKPNESVKGHDVETLFNRYKKLYKAKRFQFKLHFKAEYPGLEPPEILEAKKEMPPQDQLNRYPTSNEGIEWEGIFSIEPISFLEIINKIKSDFEKIKIEIQNKG